MKKAHLSLMILFFAPIVACGWLDEQEAKIGKENAAQEKSADYVYGRLQEISSLIRKTGSKALVAKCTPENLKALKTANGGAEILKIDLHAIDYALTDNSGKKSDDKESDSAADKHEWWNIFRSDVFKDICPRDKFLDNFDAVKAEKALKSDRILAVFMNARVVYPKYVSDKNFVGGSYVGLIVFVDLRENAVIYTYPLKAASSSVQLSILHGVLEGGDDSALKEDFRRNIRIASEKVISGISGKK